MGQPNGPAGRDTNYERWRWQIFAVTWLAYAGLYLTRKSFAVAKIGIGADPALGMTDRDMAWVDGGYLVAYAAGQFLFGMAGDRAGTRRVIAVGMLTSVAAAAAMGASTLTLAFGVLLCVQGLAQSTGWGPLVKNMSAFFSRRERGTVMGLWSTNYPLGGLVASVVAGWAGDRLGWRYAFFVPAALLLGVWVLFLLFQRDQPEDVGLPPVEQYHGEPAPVLAPGGDAAAAAAGTDAEGSWATIRAVLTNRMVLLFAAVYFLLKPARYAILLWGPKYMNARLGSGMAESGILSAMFELAGPIGALAAGVLSDRLFGTRRVPICVVCLLLLGGALFAFNRLPADRWPLAGGFFVVGLLLFAPDSLLAGTAAVDFATKRGASTASGLVNGCGSVGAIVGGTIPGFFNDRWGWDGVFAVLGAMSVLAGLLLLPRWNALPPTAEPPGFDVLSPTQPTAPSKV